LHGTFTAPGINATFTGAMIGTYANPNGTAYTTWNADGSSDIAATGGSPTAVMATGTLPSGDTGVVTINISHIAAAPAAGTFSCANGGDYQVAVAFQVFPAGGTTAVNQYSTAVGSQSACTITFQAPTMVEESGQGSSFAVYFAHGSLTATMAQDIPGANPGTGTGMMSVTW
jgi:hypothetical protein